MLAYFTTYLLSWIKDLHLSQSTLAMINNNSDGYYAVCYKFYPFMRTKFITLFVHSDFHSCLVLFLMYSFAKSTSVVHD